VRLLGAISLAAAAALLAGCAASRKTVVKPAQAPVPLQTAAKGDLVAQYNRLAGAINSLDAAVILKLTAGAAYTGVIEQYHEINGFILAQKPSNIRVIGQAPVVGKDIFDMTSDGETFRIFIPSKNEFVTGPANLGRPAAKPIENLRPQHLLDAIFWPPIPEGNPVLFEQAAETSGAQPRYFILTVLQPTGGAPGATNIAAAGSTDWEIARKIWFDRADLTLSRIQIYAPGGIMTSETRYGGWDTFNGEKYPRHILLARPASDYQLEIGINKMTTNAPIASDRFVLNQPPGTRLVEEGEGMSGHSPEPQR
jgi:hypothetical protein